MPSNQSIWDVLVTAAWRMWLWGASNNGKISRYLIAVYQNYPSERKME